MSAIQRVPLSLQCGFSLALLVGLLVLPGRALGGGVGVFNGTGLHFGEALGENAEHGRWLDEGGGIELFLGARDSRLKGRLRFAYNAIIDLDAMRVAGSEETSLHASAARHSGVMSVGATIGLLPDVTRKFSLYLATDMGISPLVQDMRFYFFADLGPGVRFHVADQLTLFAELCGLFRYDTSFSGGVLLALGARFPFE